MTYKVTYLSNMRGSFILHSNRSCEHQRRPIACARTHSRGRGTSSGAKRPSFQKSGRNRFNLGVFPYNIVTSYYFYIYGVGPSHFIVLKSDPLDGRWTSTHPQDEDPGIRYWAIEAGAFAQHFFERCGIDRLMLYPPLQGHFSNFSITPKHTSTTHPEALLKSFTKRSEVQHQA